MELRLQRRWQALVGELLEDAALCRQAADESTQLLVALSPAAATRARRARAG